MTTTDALVGRTVLALDDLLADDELLADALADRPALLGTAAVDQADAAAREARELLDRAADLLGAAAGQCRTSDAPGWARLAILDTFVRWTLGRATTCLHAPDARRPRPVLAAAWKPGLIACPSCVHLVTLPHGSRADRTCDACGHVTTGPEHGDGIRPGAVTYGPMTWLHGVCERCAHELPGDAQ
ncbi:hypothetical protein ACL02T_12685 [Pseudonocardia sp. RS010]|uniref:hypothetical protein n=1 Tax=Pseudonocardia sp. RS010 TaxID=3385979 RepID=UPI0039A0FEC5